MERKLLDISDYQNPSDEFKKDVAFANDVLNKVYEKIGNAMKVDKSRLGNIVHGGEYVLSKADHKARRDLLDSHHEGEYVIRSMGVDDEIVININVPD